MQIKERPASFIQRRSKNNLLNLYLCAVRLSGPVHPSDRTGLPEGEGPARHARLFGDAERQPAAEHGGRFKDRPQRTPDADFQVSSVLRLFFLCLLKAESQGWGDREGSTRLKIN